MLKILKLNKNVPTVAGTLTFAPVSSNTDTPIRFFPDGPVLGVDRYGDEQFVTRSNDWQWSVEDFEEIYGQLPSELVAGDSFRCELQLKDGNDLIAAAQMADDADTDPLDQ